MREQWIHSRIGSERDRFSSNGFLTFF